MFHKTHPKDLTQKTFDINPKSARYFVTAIGAMLEVFLGFFGLFCFCVWYQLCCLE